MANERTTQLLGGAKAVHFVGIGGIGMSGVAKVLLGLGCRVSGSDLKPSPLLDKLAAQGARVLIGHRAANVEDAEAVIVTGAVPPDNDEVREAQRRGLPILRRAEVLGQLLARQRGIAVSGTHGKSTTSALIAFVLEKGGLDPTVLLGGEVELFDGNAKLGRGAWCVAEADEYQETFLALRPEVAVVTNIEREHLDFYKDEAHLLRAFREFVSRPPAHGCCVLCMDDANVRRVVEAAGGRVVGYGFAHAAELERHSVRSLLQARSAQLRGRGSVFEVRQQGERLGEVRLSIPGRHNILNALAAIAVAQHAGLDFAVAAEILPQFAGVRRRFEWVGEVNGVLVFEDYAHHPSEIAATLEAAKEGYGRRVWAAFQPHLYSRTQQFVEEFAQSFAAADGVVIVEVYPAREKPIEGVSGRLIVESIRRRFPEKPVAFAPTKEETLPILRDWARAGDLVVFMGAGDIGEMGRAFTGIGTR